MVAMQADEPQFTSEDIEALTGSIIDAQVLAQWHHRGAWLTPVKRPRRGRPYLYDLAHLFEAKFCAELVGLGVSQRAARATLETLLMSEAIGRRMARRQGRIARHGRRPFAGNLGPARHAGRDAALMGDLFRWRDRYA